jgi:hypothetical protein
VTDLFVLAAEAKARRRRDLLVALSGRTTMEQALEGAAGRPAAGFDRGARRSVRPDPETHEQTLTRLFRTGEANAGRRL